MDSIWMELIGWPFIWGAVQYANAQGMKGKEFSLSKLNGWIIFGLIVLGVSIIDVF